MSTKNGQVIDAAIDDVLAAESAKSEQPVPQRIAPKVLEKLRLMQQEITSLQTQLDARRAQQQAYANGWLQALDIDEEQHHVPMDLDSGTYVVLPKAPSEAPQASA